MLQVRSVRMDMAQDGTAGRVHGVVFQGVLKFPFEAASFVCPGKMIPTTSSGMGEPMHNLDNVLAAIHALSDSAAGQARTPHSHLTTPT